MPLKETAGGRSKGSGVGVTLYFLKKQDKICSLTAASWNGQNGKELQLTQLRLADAKISQLKKRDKKLWTSELFSSVRSSSLFNDRHYDDEKPLDQLFLTLRVKMFPMRVRTRKPPGPNGTFYSHVRGHFRRKDSA